MQVVRLCQQFGDTLVVNFNPRSLKRVQTFAHAQEFFQLIRRNRNAVVLDFRTKRKQLVFAKRRARFNFQLHFCRLMHPRPPARHLRANAHAFVQFKLMQKLVCFLVGKVHGLEQLACVQQFANETRFLLKRRQRAYQLQDICLVMLVFFQRMSKRVMLNVPVFKLGVACHKRKRILRALTFRKVKKYLPRNRKRQTFFLVVVGNRVRVVRNFLLEQPR